MAPELMLFFKDFVYNNQDVKFHFE